MSMYGESGRMESADEVRYVSAYLVHEQVLQSVNPFVISSNSFDHILAD